MREAMVAMGPISVAVLGLLVSRREETLALVMLRTGVAGHFSTLWAFGCLACTPFIAVAAVSVDDVGRGLALLAFVQAYGVIWGLMILLFPLLTPIVAALYASLNDRARRMAWLLLYVVPSVGAVVAMLVLIGSWYLSLSIVLVAVAVTAFEQRYGSPVERLLGRRTDDTSMS